MIDDPNGYTIGVGTVTRTIPAWLLRVLKERDRVCRFPGCDHTRWLHAHHIIHWAHRGPTNADNLVLLCGFHHRMIHNKAWTITGNPNAEITFLNQWGYEHVRPIDPLPDNWVQRRNAWIDQQADERIRQLQTSGSPP